MSEPQEPFYVPVKIMRDPEPIDWRKILVALGLTVAMAFIAAYGQRKMGEPDFLEHIGARLKWKQHEDVSSVPSHSDLRSLYDDTR